MECVELAPAVGCVARFESGSKLHALHTLRAVWFRLCRPGDRRALPAAVTEALPIPFFSGRQTKKIEDDDDDFLFPSVCGSILPRPFSLRSLRSSNRLLLVVSCQFV